MYKSIIVIPLGGLGSRFSSANYSLPKPLINVLGKPILFWLLDNLSIGSDQLVYIPYNNILSNYHFEEIVKRHYSNLNLKFLKLENDTDGAAHTMKIALETLDIPDIPIISIDGDNFYTVDILSQWDKQNGIFYFNDTNPIPIYSYLELDHNSSNVIDIVEKSKISDNACCGVYAFESYRTLLKYCNHIMDKKIKDKNEYYISTVIKQLINDNYTFKGHSVQNESYNCLGTPLLVKLFCSKNQQNIIKPKRYCFDLDNTLVSFPKIKNDYTTVEPIEKNIKFLRFLKQLGHTIIIYTARRMQTHSYNVGRVLADIGKITFDTLEKFNIPYDEIYFGKPLADFYIDDLAASAYDNLEKITGFYQLTIEPRDFNQIESNLNQTYTKKSSDLSNEIYYYKNIPNELQDIFPKLINYDPNNQWFEMEKINGLSFSNMYLDRELTESVFTNLLKTVHRLHTFQLGLDLGLDLGLNIDIDIYANYSNKLEERFRNYDYSSYPNYEKTYSEILSKLKEYEELKTAKPVIIHGDPVFTNVLLDKEGKVKLIDMRGKLGKVNTIYGDPLYDYGKILQSLIGYDEILFGVNVPNSYKSKFIEILFNFIKENYGNSHTMLKYIKIVTQSLLFSLIPLHKNNKCLEYYRLINQAHLN